MTFLYHSNFEWRQTLKIVYEQNVNVNSFDYTTDRVKIFDNVKAYKKSVLKKMKILFSK